MNPYFIRFLGAPQPNNIYTEKGAYPSSLEEAIEASEERYGEVGFEVWGPDGDYQSQAFIDEYADESN